MPRKRRKADHAKKERRKPGVSRKQFLTSPVFKNSRIAAGDFGRASKCAVLIRGELADMLEKMKQNDIHRKLSQVIGRIIREKRTAGAERVRLNDIRWKKLEEMELNTKTGTGTLLAGSSKVIVDTVSGKIELIHPSFILTRKVMAKKAITHVRLIAGVAAIDFTQKTACHDQAATDHIPKEQVLEGEIKLSMRLPAPVCHPVFVVFGFLSFQQDKDKLYELYNLSLRALRIVYVHPAPAKPIKKAKPKTPVKKPRPSRKTKK